MTGLRHDLRMFARMSQFRCFHETRQTQNEVERFFLQLGRFSLRTLLRHSGNFGNFWKVLSQYAFRNMIVPLPRSQTRHPAPAQAPLHLPHKFFDVKSFIKFPPFSQLISPNLAKTLLVLAPDMLFSCGDWATSEAQKDNCDQG